MFPLYLRNGVDAYMADHPGNTVATVLLHGLRALGIDIDDADLVPERATRSPRKRQERPAGALDAAVVVSSFDLPRYVLGGVEDYLCQHPDMAIRNVAMAGLKALGIEVQDADLTRKNSIFNRGNRTPPGRRAQAQPTRGATRAA